MISWIDKYPRAWRAGVLVLLLVALRGPWAFDLINVPSEYTCSAPHVRLYDDFCGIPLSGLRLLTWMIGGLVEFLRTGGVPPDRAREFFILVLFLIALLLLLLPFFSTLLLMLRGAFRRQRIFTTVTWCLAAGVSLLLGVLNRPRLFWALWGLWLYVAVAVSALILEVLTLMAHRSSSPG